ncbi:hypothetical protein RND71_042696 [Anisodus tanguticus]|uniref:Plasma membrane ATPase n=1 Tax=Anisodus tanguticus TaxID=243964 RepID=A0AAE1QRZ8_9SOLA|nr:hypothetical protein RND71_042696 [Anisodus tanguticus]
MATEKTTTTLEAINNETVDLENIPIKEVFENLKCTEEGLNSAEVEKRLNVFGHNKLEEKKNKGIDYQDFVGIVALLIINSTISFIEENNAGNAAAALMARLAPKAKVLRDGKWSEEDAAVLVPGDIISIKLGDIIPADARLLNVCSYRRVTSGYQNPGDGVYSGSTCKQGEIEAVVIATGVHTFFGKAAHLVENTTHVGHFQKVLTSIGNFCICSIATGMIIELIVIFGGQHRPPREAVDSLLVLLIGGIPIAMPTVLSVTMAIGSHRLSQQGAITKRMTAIEEMAGMDVLCSDKTGTLTLNKLSVDKNLVEVFAKDVEKDMVVLMAARASRLENQDAIDTAIVSMLADPKEARAGITEVHFLPFNPTDKRTALTYLDSAGKMHRVSKGAPEQILNLAWNKSDIQNRVHSVIDKFAERGLRSLAVARQEVPEGTKDSPGGLWEFVGLLPLFDPPRHDSAETIRRALELGISVKMITGDQLAIGKETGRRLGMGTNMYPSSFLLGEQKDASAAILPIEELIESADGFAGVFPEHKYEIVRILQSRGHICGMTGDGVNDAPALKKADIGIGVADATDAARGASDIVLTEPGLSVIIHAIYAVSITIRIVLGFMLLTAFWKFNFPPFMVLVIAILNDGTIMTISKDRVKPSPLPDTWKLSEIFATGIVIGSYLALMTALFFYLMFETSFFANAFHVEDFNKHIPSNKVFTDSLNAKLASAVYLQVSTISQALIFVTRSRGWSFMERPGLLLVAAFIVAQMVATFMSAMVTSVKFAGIEKIGWRWTGVIWLFNIITYFLLDPIKFSVRYALSGRAWGLLLNQKEAREAAWAAEQRTIHGLQSAETRTFPENYTFREISIMAEEAKRRADIARLRELHTLKGRVESFAKLRGLDVDHVNPHYTV